MNKHMEQICKRSGEVTIKDPLVEFLYILMRDHLPVGTIEEIVMKHVRGTKTVYSNGWLAEYAQDVAVRLKEKVK